MKLLRSISLQNLLSYGSEGIELDLESLNVLIGPNAAGKSNLIDALKILAAAPSDLSRVLLEGGGISDWIWKGPVGQRKAVIEVVLEYPAFRYRLEFTTALNSRLRIVRESLENEVGPDPTPYSYGASRFCVGRS